MPGRGVGREGAAQGEQHCLHPDELELRVPKSERQRAPGDNAHGSPGLKALLVVPLPLVSAALLWVVGLLQPAGP